MAAAVVGMVAVVGMAAVAVCTPAVACAVAVVVALVSAHDRRYRVHMLGQAPAAAMSRARTLWATALPPLATRPVPQEST
jgi:type IV secretory pathway VirB3-like protein